MATAFLAPRRRASCAHWAIEVIELYSEVDGDFPNHHPDPSKPENLADLIRTVQATGAELGLAFDGDGDRLGVVTRDGQIIYPDRQLMLFAGDVLSRHRGASILFDVKCSMHLAPMIRRAGGVPLMWMTGHSLMKAKLKESGAPLAGEMSGHIFFSERWYGFDDATYTAARLLEILSRSKDPSAVLNALPTSLSTPELNVPCAEGEHHRVVQQLREQAQFDGATELITIDGLRAEYADGFGLVRASNTTPVLVLRFEGDSPDALQRIQTQFMAALRAVKPDAHDRHGRALNTTPRASARARAAADEELAGARCVLDAAARADAGLPAASVVARPARAAVPACAGRASGLRLPRRATGRAVAACGVAGRNARCRRVGRRAACAAPRACVCC